MHTVDKNNPEESKFDYRKNWWWESTWRYSDQKYSWNGRFEESSGTASWRHKNWEKVMKRHRSSHHKYRSYKRGWIAWMIQQHFKIYNRFAVENCRTFLVIQQAFQVFDMCWAATRACHLIHGMCLGHREMFLAIHVTCSIHHRHRIKEFFTLRTEVPQVENSVQKSTGRLVAEGEERIESTTPKPMSAGRPSTMTFYLPAEIPQNSLYRKDCKYRSFSSMIPYTFNVFMFEDMIQNPGEFLFRFSLGSHGMDERSGGINWGRISRILKCWTREVLLFLTRSSRILTSRKRSAWRNRKLQKTVVSFAEDWSLTWSMVTGAHDTVLDEAELFSITPGNDDVQEFDTRCDAFLLSMTKSPLMMFFEGLYKLRILESDQLETVLEMYDMEIHQKLSMPNCQRLNGEEKYRSETSFPKFWRQERENWDRGCGYESQVILWHWKRKRSLPSVESKRTVF